MSDISRLSYAFNIAMCKIYTVKFGWLDVICSYTSQTDISQDILRHGEVYMHSSNS